MGFGRSSFPHRAPPSPSALWSPDLRARRGKRSSPRDSRRFSVAWVENLESDALRVSVRSLTYALGPGGRCREGFLRRLL